jgi:3-deoxy-manno-octulosonate cytidylyltransferase (CMP-KDO synthetase)
VLEFTVLVPDSTNQTTGTSAPLAVIVIPARYASTRFPGKALADLGGRPMIEHVYRRAAASSAAASVIVATDDVRIARAVEAFGGEVRLTRASHRSGTERLAEVAAALTCDLVVNVQGDEPLLEAAMIDEAVRPLAADPSIEMGTLRRRIEDPADLDNPNVVKVVVDRDDFALYFSRAPIPYGRGRPAHAAVYRHIGLYVYRRGFLLTLAGLPPTPLEEAEMLEQLRALEHGYRIKAVETAFDSHGVDTPADLERVRRLMSARADGAPPGAEATVHHQPTVSEC